MKHPEDVATVDSSLRLATGVHPEERPTILDHWAPLDARLRSFRADQVEMRLSIKERDTVGQKTTLEAWVAGWSPLVATSTRTEFDAAINEVRDDLIRQLSDHKHKHEPRNNKHLRETTRR